MLQVVQTLYTVLGILDCLAGKRQKLLACLGERYMAAVTQEEFKPEFKLQLLYLLREGALCNLQVLGGNR